MLRAFPLILDTIVLVMTVSLGWLMPMLTRRDILFGVTVAPDTRAQPAGQAIIRRYRGQMLGLALLFVLGLGLLAIFASDTWWASVWTSLIVLALMAYMSVPYLLAYFASRALRVVPQEGGAEAEPSTSPVAELRPRHYGDYVPLLWEALPLAIIAATAIFLATSYANAPAIIPIHFNVAGKPNSYATKAIGSYFSMIWVQLGLEVLMTGVALLIVSAKALPGRAESRFRRVWLRYLFGMKALTLAFLGALAVLIANAAQTGSGGQITVILPITLVYVVVLLGSAIFLAVRTGQGGALLGSPAETALDRMNDRYWKLGGIYVNPQDPSWFVEKRFGVGWTLNFGNPWSILAMCGLLAVIVLVPILLAVLNVRK
jgi:uncharacterized membrane protein